MCQLHSGFRYPPAAPKTFGLETREPLRFGRSRREPEPNVAAIGRQSRIAVAGAGSVGCYVGGCLALAGRAVTLLARPALAEAISRRGLRISDLDGADRTLAPSTISCTADPASALSGAGLVLLTVKSGATREMAELIARHAPSDAVVVSLQNGVGNLEVMRGYLQGSQRAVPGMVAFNVVQTQDAEQPPRFHRGTSGGIVIASGIGGLRDCLHVPGLSVTERGDMAAVLWGKLLLNLNNALNALSGLPLATQLADRRWRLLLAAQMDEALAVLKAAQHPSGLHGGRAAARHPADPAAARCAVPGRGAAHDVDRSAGALLHVGGPAAAPRRPRSTTCRAPSWHSPRGQACRRP